MSKTAFLSALLAIITSAANALTLTSPTVAEGKKLGIDHVYQGFGCDGNNIAPALAWSNVPAETKSFAVTLYDPDAPTGSGWWHWFVFNIPAEARKLPAGGALPAGAIALTNDYGTVGFGGACPPKGEVHRYQLTLHALDTTLEIDETVSNALAGFMVNAHSIASDTITAIYYH